MGASEQQETGKQVDLTVYVPCYNEEELVSKTLDDIREAASVFDFTYEVLIYNDASIDRTAEVAEAYIQEHHLEDHFFVISNEVNRGIGINYFSAAERGRGQYFMGVAGDNGEPAECLKRIFNLMGKADLIIPYFDTRLFDLRFNGDNRSFGRRATSIAFAWLVRLISGHNIKYFNACVLHKRENVLKYRTDAYGLGYQAELICTVLSQPGADFLEVRVFNYDRVAGAATAFKPKNVVSVAGSLWRILKKRRFARPPKPTR